MAGMTTVINLDRNSTSGIRISPTTVKGVSTKQIAYYPRHGPLQSSETPNMSLRKRDRVSTYK